MNSLMTVGFEIPGHSDKLHRYSSSQSLLDSDIVLFEATFDDYHSGEDFQGKPLFDERRSFQIQDDTSHWRTEITAAVRDGKTVFVIAGKLQSVFLHTGGVAYSGTGRNARSTRNVVPTDNYQALPLKLPSIIPKGGTQLVFANVPLFARFWREFKDYLSYECYFDGSIGQPLFFTRTGSKIVGSIIKSNQGNIVLLPPIRYPRNKFITRKGSTPAWTKEALAFGERLFEVLIDIDSALRGERETTPPPDWAQSPAYQTQSEKSLIKEIAESSAQIETLMEQKSALLRSLDEEGTLRNLLFESGKPLEDGVIEALKILGYSAEGYSDGSLEIDQIAVDPEGSRFVGETEGKDSSAINIDKFRQLTSNIHEDALRDEVAEPAMGVLFGNAYRLEPLSERADYFTTKCLTTARDFNVVLIRTPDLFRVAQYVKETGDLEYAKRCREIILAGRGQIVEFPNSEPPSKPSARKKIQ